MRPTVWVFGLGACLVGLVGCTAGGGSTLFSTGGGIGDVDAAAYGVADWLRGVDTLETTALVTTYDADGAARVTTQQLSIDPQGRWISARCYLPGGSWTAKINLDKWSVRNPIGVGWVNDHDDLQLTGEQKDAVAGTLRLILHRVLGPANLSGGGEKILASDRVFAAGYEMTRFKAAGRKALASAYFFDDGREGLRVVTQGGVEPTEAGTVTVYRNMRTADGVMLPAELEVSNLGENSLIGRKKILSVRLTDVKIRD